MLKFDSKFYLHINGTAMGIIFGPKQQMGHHETNVYSVIYQSYPLASKYFENSQFRFLDDCQILNQISNIQVTMEKSQTRLPFLDIMINQSDRKIWMNIYNRPTDTKKNKKSPIYKKTPMALFNKYTILSRKKNIYHCRVQQKRFPLVCQVTQSNFPVYAQRT